MTVDQALIRLKKSSFRAGFHLTKGEKSYFLEKGAVKIRSHAEDFVAARLAPAVIPNDGRQTPMRAHPVFKAQHACACCCRGCLERWYHIPRGRELNESERERIVNLLMAWIESEMR